MTELLHMRAKRAASHGFTHLALAVTALSLLTAGPAMTAQEATLAPGSAHYTIYQGTKSLGESQYTLAPIPGGFTLTSSGHMSLGKFSYSFRNQATVDTSMNLVRDALTGSVNGAKANGSNISFNTASDPTGRELRINISADGKQTTNTVDRHRNMVLVPDLDPGAYMLMAHLALLQPPTDWVLIPKGNGVLVPTAYQLEADVPGTLNGAPVSAHHATAALSATNSITLELYYLGDGRLLEADLNAQNFYVVRDGFKLAHHPKPTPPPPGEAPPQPGDQTQQPAQMAQPQDTRTQQMMDQKQAMMAAKQAQVDGKMQQQPASQTDSPE